MKKIILLLLLALVSVSVSARKSYITVFTYNFNGEADGDDIILTGDIPDNLEGFEYNSDFHYWCSNPSIRDYSTGELLTKLSEAGYDVEFVMLNSGRLNYLLSKEIPSGNQPEVYGDVNKDGSVNISDISELVHIILDYVRANPSILEESK